MGAAQLAACPENARPLPAQLALVYVLRAVPLMWTNPLSGTPLSGSVTEHGPYLCCLKRPPYLSPRCHVTEVHKLQEKSFAELVGHLPSKREQVAGGCTAGEARSSDGQLQCHRERPSGGSQWPRDPGHQP